MISHKLKRCQFPNPNINPKENISKSFTNRPIKLAPNDSFLQNSKVTQKKENIQKTSTKEAAGEEERKESVPWLGS